MNWQANASPCQLRFWWAMLEGIKAALLEKSHLNINAVLKGETPNLV